MKVLLKLGLFAGLLIGASYGYLVWKNNRDVLPPEQEEVAVALEKTIQWLQENRDDLLKKRTAPSLWRFVQQSGEITGDVRLQELFGAYEKRYLANHSAVWRPLFYPGAWVPIPDEVVNGLSYYRQHFVYAMTCDHELGKRPEIAAQNSPDFCDSRPFRPACVTHQLMGIRMLQEIECGDQVEVQNTVQQLQRRIVRQLIWDPRVVDVYLQRVLMLAESGGSELIKPVWLQNLIDAQRPDGGWSGYDPLLRVGDHHITFGPRGFTLRAPDSNFHATAQAVLLLSIMTPSESAP